MPFEASSFRTKKIRKFLGQTVYISNDYFLNNIYCFHFTYNSVKNLPKIFISFNPKESSGA